MAISFRQFSEFVCEYADILSKSCLSFNTFLLDSNCRSYILFSLLKGIWKRMPWGEAEMHSFAYTNDQVLYNQFSPYFLCRVSWLPIITNLGSLSQIRLNEYQFKSISFNYNVCGIWKIFNNTRHRKYGLKKCIQPWHIDYYWCCGIKFN